MAEQRNEPAGKRPRKRPEGPSGESTDAKPVSPETASLLSLVDRLTALLERSDLIELEVESGETGIVLRKPAALLPVASAVAITAMAPGAEGAGAAGTTGGAAGGGWAGSAGPAGPISTAKVVRAPLTGVFYGAPSPASPPYVSVGQQVSTGQVIGLIEAMKLFNEIKSDTTGRVVRIVAESGKLVKAKQPLIEVEP